MKPYVICHMTISLDGRTIPGRWRPKGAHSPDLYDRLHNQLGCDGWIVGRTTGQEFAKSSAYSRSSSEHFPRTSWIARPNSSAYGVVLDAHGKIAWGRSDIGGDPIVVVLAESVPDAHLVALREESVSYIFAGKHELDLSLALETLNGELGIRRLLLEGGGNANGSFLNAGLIDEISLLIVPAVDGSSGVPALFEGTSTPIEAITLESCELMESGTAWLRYRVKAS